MWTARNLACLARLGVVVAGLSVATLEARADRDRDLDHVFKSGVELVSLNVTVTDQKQRFVTNLRPQDFAVLEDDVPQDILFFACTNVPLDLIILLDTSASMGDKQAVVRKAARGFVRTLRPGDRAAVVGFDDRLAVLQDLTDDVHALDAAIGRTDAIGNTALHAAVYVALKTFGRPARKAGEVRRQALVVLSDGEDTASGLSFDEVLSQARRSGVSVYTILLQAPQAIDRAGLVSHLSPAQYAMKALARETGAQAFFPRQVRELTGVYGAIASELAHQYALAYLPKKTLLDGGFRRISVRIPARPDVRSRTRTGYLAEAPAMRAALVGDR